ncbi:MAG: biotin--[acetyl-CoA-carboxylase] ligase [Deltaproteobacteria bacterium]|nr:MAG: biotin--[acetyl-CoA-carboxylase] ligase [Deltaproteobacteria bacterium]
MRKDIVRAFLESGGALLSGEEIARRSGLTRQALWKTVERLKREGWVIEGIPGKGYRVVSYPPEAEYELLQDSLRGGPHLDEISFFPSIDSTNSYLLSRAEKGVERALAVADSQTGGRGRMGRSWFSPPGKNIYMSYLTPLNVAPSRIPSVTLVAGVAVATVLEEFSGVPLSLKWPNDVYGEGKKLCGILTEIVAEQDMVRSVVLGVGVNVNMGEDEFPEEIRGKATSLRALSGKTFPRYKIVASIVRVLAEFLDIFERSGLSPFAGEWEKRSYLKGKQVTVEGPEGKVTGRAVGIDTERGYLILERDGGERLEVLSGEVTVREGE